MFGQTSSSCGEVRSKSLKSPETQRIAGRFAGILHGASRAVRRYAAADTSLLEADGGHTYCLRACRHSQLSAPTHRERQAFHSRTAGRGCHGSTAGQRRSCEPNPACWLGMGAMYFSLFETGVWLTCWMPLAFYRTAVSDTLRHDGECLR